MTNLNYIFLMMGQGEGQGNPVQMIIMMVLVIGVFYFFMIRPQQKKRKEMATFRSEMKKGDKVMTLGGIHGKIADIKEDTIILEMESQARIKVEKSVVIKDASGMMMQK